MRIMVIVAHPDLNHSRANRALMLASKDQPDVYVRELYLEYPNWEIDVEKEHQLLLTYDRIVFQFPFYWYSCPPLLKKWFDDVFTFGWAFGPGGVNLKGKEFVIATTTGGPENCYRAGGENEFTISEFMKPIQRTITKCHGTFLPTFVAYSASQATDADLSQVATRYVEYIHASMIALVQ